MAKVTVTLPGSSVVDVGAAIQYILGAGNYVSLGNQLSASGNEIFLGFVAFRESPGSGDFQLNDVFISIRIATSQTQNVDSVGPDFSNVMENGGTIVAQLSDGTSYSFPVPISNFDTTEPYAWRANSLSSTQESEINTFASQIGSLTDKDLTLTFDDGTSRELVGTAQLGAPVALGLLTVTPPSAPSFDNAVGNDEVWMMGIAIDDVVVPLANGHPSPIYTVVGALPPGLTFSPATRTISGTLTGIGSGTITIRASNSEGSANWSFGYTIAKAFSISLFSASGHIALLANFLVEREPRSGNADQIHLWSDGGIAPAAGSITEGSVAYNPETGNSFNTFLRRVALAITPQFFIFNRATGVSDSLDTVVGVENVTIVRNTNPVTFITLEADSNNTGGGGFVGWSVGGNGLTSTEWDFVNAIADGDQVIVALHRGVAQYDPVFALVGSATSGSPTASGTLTVGARPVVSLEGSASFGSPSAVGTLSVRDAEAINLVGSASSGSPTAVGTLSVIAPVSLALEGFASSFPPVASGELTVRAPAKTSLSGVAASGDPAAQADLTVDSLALSDFNSLGLELDSAAVIARGNEATFFYVRAPRSPVTGTLIEGEVGTGSIEAPINIIRFLGDDRLIIGDSEADLNIRQYFESGDGSDLTLHFQTDDLQFEFLVADRINSGGGNVVRFDLTSAENDIVATVGFHQRFILAFYRVLTVHLTGSASSGAPATRGLLSVSNLYEGSAVSGAPIARGTLTVADAVGADLEGSASSGSPQARAILSVTNPGQVLLTGSASSGSPRAVGTLTVVLPTPTPLTGRAVGGSPTASATLSVGFPTGTALSGFARAGEPQASGLLTVQISIGLRGIARAGNPLARGTLSVGFPVTISLTGFANSGLPLASGTLSVKDAATISLIGRAVAGSAIASGRITVDGVAGPVIIREGKLFVTVILNNEDVSVYADPVTWELDEYEGSTISTLNIELRDSEETRILAGKDPEELLDVIEWSDIILEGRYGDSYENAQQNHAERLFAGMVAEVSTVPDDESLGLIVTLSCLDWKALLDRNFFSSHFYRITDRQIISRSFALSGLDEINYGTLVDETEEELSLSFQGASLRQMMDSVTEQNGFVWDVDKYKNLIHAPEIEGRATRIAFSDDADDDATYPCYDFLKHDSSSQFNEVELHGSTRLQEIVHQTYSGNGRRVLFRLSIDSTLPENDYPRIIRGPEDDENDVPQIEVWDTELSEWIPLSVGIAGNEDVDVQWNPALSTVRFGEPPPNRREAWRISGRSLSRISTRKSDRALQRRVGHTFKKILNVPEVDTQEEADRVADAFLREQGAFNRISFMHNEDGVKIGDIVEVTHSRYRLNNEKYTVYQNVMRHLGNQEYEYKVTANRVEV